MIEKMQSKDINNIFSEWKNEAGTLLDILKESDKKKLFSNLEAKSAFKQKMNDFTSFCNTFVSLVQDKETELKNYLMTKDIMENMLGSRKTEIEFLDNESIKKQSQLNQLEVLLRDKNEEFNDLEQKIESRKTDLTSLQEEISKYEPIKSQFDIENAEKQQIIKNLNEKIQEIESKIGTTTIELTSLDEEISAKKEKFEKDQQIKNDLEEKTLELKYQLKKTDAEIAEKQQSVNSADEKLGIIKEEYMNIQQAIESHKDTVKNFNEELNSIKENIIAEKELKEKANADLTKVQTYKDYLDAEVKKLKPYLEKLEKSKEDFYHLSNEVLRLHSERVNLENRLPVIKQNFELESIKLQEIQSKYNEVNSNCQALELQKARLENEMSTIGANIQNLRIEKDSLDNYLNSLQTKISEYEVIKSKYEKEKRTIEENIADINSRFETVSNDLTKKETQLLEASSMLAEKQHFYENILNEIEYKRNQTSTLTKEDERLSEEKKLLETEIASLLEKKEFYNSEAEKAESRKIEVEKSFAPAEIKFEENRIKLEEQEKKLTEFNNQLEEKENAMQKLIADQNEKIEEFNKMKETHGQMQEEYDKFQSELAESDNKKSELQNQIIELEQKISSLEERRSSLMMEIEPLLPKVQYDQNDGFQIAKNKFEELFTWFEVFNGNLPTLNKLSETLPRTLNQNFTDLKEVFNKFKDFQSKYASFDGIARDMESKALPNNPKILDVFFNNRDLAMKEQDRIYSLLNARTMTDGEIKSLLDLYNMMMPNEILSSTETAMMNGLQKISEIVKSINIEVLMHEIKSNLELVE